MLNQSQASKENNIVNYIKHPIVCFRLSSFLHLNMYTLYTIVYTIDNILYTKLGIHKFSEQIFFKIL
jgi:hypothetical protein